MILCAPPQFTQSMLMGYIRDDVTHASHAHNMSAFFWDGTPLFIFLGGAILAGIDGFILIVCLLWACFMRARTRTRMGSIKLGLCVGVPLGVALGVPLSVSNPDVGWQGGMFAGGMFGIGSTIVVGVAAGCAPFGGTFCCPPCLDKHQRPKCRWLLGRGVAGCWIGFHLWALLWTVFVTYWGMWFIGPEFSSPVIIGTTFDPSANLTFPEPYKSRGDGCLGLPNIHSKLGPKNDGVTILTPLPYTAAPSRVGSHIDETFGETCSERCLALTQSFFYSYAYSYNPESNCHDGRYASEGTACNTVDQSTGMVGCVAWTAHDTPFVDGSSINHNQTCQFYAAIYSSQVYVDPGLVEVNLTAHRCTGWCAAGAVKLTYIAKYFGQQPRSAICGGARRGPCDGRGGLLQPLDGPPVQETFAVVLLLLPALWSCWVVLRLRRSYVNGDPARSAAVRLLLTFLPVSFMALESAKLACLPSGSFANGYAIVLLISNIPALMYTRAKCAELLAEQHLFQNSDAVGGHRSATEGSTFRPDAIARGANIQSMPDAAVPPTEPEAMPLLQLTIQDLGALRGELEHCKERSGALEFYHVVGELCIGLKAVWLSVVAHGDPDGGANSPLFLLIALKELGPYVLVMLVTLAEPMRCCSLIAGVPRWLSGQSDAEFKVLRDQIRGQQRPNTRGCCTLTRIVPNTFQVASICMGISVCNLAFTPYNFPHVHGYEGGGGTGHDCMELVPDDIAWIVVGIVPISLLAVPFLLPSKGRSTR